MSKVVLSLDNISKSFYQGKTRLVVLKNASLEVKEGEVVGLIGPSGSGKSTLLQVAGLLDNAGSGEVIIDGVNCTHADDKMRTKMRRDHIGFVYQMHHLLPEFTALENVLMPQLISKRSTKESENNAKEILRFLGLGARVKHRPSQLSGGEQQRVAIARAIVNKPSLILADEPTGNLDPETSDIVFDLMLKTARSIGLAMLIVTHNHELAKKMDKVVTLKDGMVVKAKKS